ncbi:MAG: anti-sigma factor antagonist [Bacillota bacterium]|nr:anti-sigma factor antagonist [Bacillota bacterium]
MKESYTVINKTLIASLSGELDQHSAVQVRAELDRRIKEGCNNLVFDFKRLEFMDSSGIGVIIGRYKLVMALGGAICIACPKPQVERIIHLATIDRLIPIYKSVDDALKSMRGDRVG